MDPVANPFAPGAGSRPPALAGRDELLEAADIALRRIQAGRHAKSMMLLGLRGVGKTVLLVRIGELAEATGYATALIEAPEERRLAGLLVPRLRSLLYRLSRSEKARILSNRALGALRNFASAFKVSYAGLEVGVNAEPGLAASGDLETDLTDLLVVVGEAAKAADQPTAILIDEVQYLNDEDLSALIVALHRISQRALPLIMLGAGLPQLAAVSGEAKSYAERLFAFPNVGPLDESSIETAIRVPIEEAGASISDDALSEIGARTEGYPYFLQEWGAHSWDAAPESPITRRDVVSAGTRAVAALDASFFRVRFDRLTPKEQEYLRAMAELGPGPHRSGEVAAELGIAVTSAGPRRTGLIAKGMIWSPSHGLTAFTVPMFDRYMLRAMPDWPPAESQRPRRSRGNVS
ncbi:ATP-binding protein [Candidatus Palauibacter sp.]|uniref:ATP-binding protein n=1 Tax=Candidatus Palauibacter sp. TaxID=3101350 RepID=UPI003B02D23F